MVVSMSGFPFYENFHRRIPTWFGELKYKKHICNIYFIRFLTMTIFDLWILVGAHDIIELVIIFVL
jgi:hypothetical protein